MMMADKERIVGRLECPNDWNCYQIMGTAVGAIKNLGINLLSVFGVLRQKSAK
jgi:hypothetical protein